MKKIIIVIIISITLIIYISHNQDCTKTLNSNWNIQIPKESKYQEIYHKTDEPNFLGDGIRYHIFTYKNEKYIDLLLEWETKENATKFHSSYSKAITNWLNEINVPKNKHPDYQRCTYWYNIKEDNSEIIILKSKKENKIYIIESFM